MFAKEKVMGDPDDYGQSLGDDYRDIGETGAGDYVDSTYSDD